MTESQSRDAVLRRLGEMVDLELRILGMLDRLQAEVRDPVQAVAALRQFRGMVEEQLAALGARLEAVTEGASPGGAASGHPRSDDAHPRSASDALAASVSAFAEAVAAYSTLYTTARLMFDGATCDLAQRHLHTYAQALQAANWLIPDVVGWELRQEDLNCHCICPACSLGACLCIRTSVDILRAGWGATPPFGTPIARAERVDALLEGWAVVGVPGGRGVVLRAPPRPGSQLAAAGIQQGDRILLVDGQEVNTNLELQNAIRRHRIGDELTLHIEHSAGEASEVLVRHLSDF